MKIKFLKMKNFRNYEFEKIELDKGINIFYGENAQGKTNILEALYLSGTTKSHRKSKETEMIRFEQEEAHVEVLLEKKGIEHQIDLHLKKYYPKGIAINKKPIRKAGELLGFIQFVLFSPEDLNIIKNGPAHRRRFMDLEISKLDQIYLKDIFHYHKIIVQRNRVLKDFKENEEIRDTLDIWDEQLAFYGKRVIERRKLFIKQINELIKPIHQNLTGGKEKIHLEYESDVGEEDFLKCLKKQREKDLRWKNTSIGPHKDDICFFVNDLDIRKYGSQGQQRTTALSLKLAEIELIQLISKEMPVLLLDDVLSEIDRNRQEYLIRSIKNIQTLITCTELEELIKYQFPFQKVFRVKKGKVREERIENKYE